MYYENFLNKLNPDTMFIPESASFNDMGIFTERAIQDAYNEATISIAAQEMAMFESAIALNELSSDALNKSTANKKSGLLEKIKQFFKTIWEKIKGFFTAIINKIKEVFTRFKLERGKVLQADFERALGKLPKDFKVKDIVPFDAYKKIYRFAIGNIDVADQNVNDAYAFMKKNLKSFDANDMAAYDKDAVAKKFKRFDSESDITFKKWIEAATDNTVKDNDGKVTGTKEISASEIASNKSAIIDVVFNGKDWTTAVKKCYESSKKNVDKSMNRAKEIVNANPDGIRAFLSICKQSISLMTKISNLMTSSMKSIRSNYVGLVSKVIVASKSKKKVNESTRIFDDFLDESFNYVLEGEDEKSVEDIDVDVEDVASDDSSVDEAAALYNSLVNYMD